MLQCRVIYVCTTKVIFHKLVVKKKSITAKKVKLFLLKLRIFSSAIKFLSLKTSLLKHMSQNSASFLKQTKFFPLLRVQKICGICNLCENVRKQLFVERVFFGTLVENSSLYSLKNSKPCSLLKHLRIKKKKKKWQQDVCPCKLGEKCIYYVVMCQIMPDLHSVIKPIKDVQF